MDNLYVRIINLFLKPSPETCRTADTGSFLPFLSSLMAASHTSIPRDSSTSTEPRYLTLKLHRLFRTFSSSDSNLVGFFYKINKDVFFWFQTMHPEDREFVASSLALSVELQESLPREKSDLVLVNIYLRMLDKSNQFRWVLMQFPKRLYNKNGKIISTLIVITDL